MGWGMLRWSRVHAQGPAFTVRLPALSRKPQAFPGCRDRRCAAAQGGLPLWPATATRRARFSEARIRIGRPMLELLRFIDYLITLYVYIVLASVILSWLMAFGVV